MQNPSLIEKIQELSPEKINEVEDFVDFLAIKSKVNKRIQRNKMLLDYAQKFGGTDVDLDENLETASIENLLDNIKYR
ncbi:MAG: DUF2281 domain-containing protein [Aridibacter sp.]